MGGNVVHRLTKNLPYHQNFKLYFDNFFSSVTLMNFLKEKGILAVATLRKDRMKGSQNHLLPENDLKKRGRGSHDYAVEANSGIITVRWYDNNCVQLISNYLTNEAGINARRWNKKNTSFEEVERPVIVQVYNVNMGGVDLCDMLLSLYRIRQRTNKFYFHVVYYLLGLSVTNGWLLYRRHQNQKSIHEKDQLSMLEFQTDTANDLQSAGKLAPASRRSRERPSLNTTVEDPPKSIERQQFQTLLIIHVLINLIIFLYFKRSSNGAENAEQDIFL